MSAPFQLFDDLDPATEAALTASISRFGVLVPVVVDQHRRILDGHHRARIADRLGVPYEIRVVRVTDDREAGEVARTLNEDRRHLTPEQRRQVVVALASVREVRDDGQTVQVHSPRAIAGAVGVDEKTVRNDLEQLRTDPQLPPPDLVRGRDGRDRPATHPTPDPRADPFPKLPRRPMTDEEEKEFAKRRLFTRLAEAVATTQNVRHYLVVDEFDPKYLDPPELIRNFTPEFLTESVRNLQAIIEWRRDCG